MAKSNLTKTDRLKQIWKKSNGVCAHCGKVPSTKMRTVDHYVPRAAGGGFDKRNLMPLCKSCNKDRQNYSIQPEVFYRYATPDAIRQCLEYEREFMFNRKSMSGENY